MQQFFTRIFALLRLFFVINYLRHTLKILQEIELENFPMAKFIVGASTDVQPPKYLLYNRHLISVATFPPFSPLQSYTWPSADQLKLDTMQYQAFKACLTREFAIVQGRLPLLYVLNL